MSSMTVVRRIGITQKTAVSAAWLAFIVGLVYAAVSAYWGLGGTWLLDTLGGTLEGEARDRSAGALGVVWATAALKVVGAVLPLIAIRSGIPRLIRALAWLEATILTAYGLVLTAIGLLVQVRIVTVAADADPHALAWHAYLWDPWFLVWGVLVTLAMVSSRNLRSSSNRDPTGVASAP